MTSTMMLEISKLATRQDIDEIYDALKAKTASLDYSSSINFSEGNKVSFTSSKSGTKYTGKITKINRKNAVVLTDAPNIKMYSVPFSMLKKEV